MYKQMLRCIFLLSFVILNSVCLSDEGYFLTLRYNEVNLRQGPSNEYPIKIFYKKKYLPVLIMDQSENYRKIIDHENNTGWIHISQLSKKRQRLSKMMI